MVAECSDDVTWHIVSECILMLLFVGSVVASVPTHFAEVVVSDHNCRIWNRMLGSQLVLSWWGSSSRAPWCHSMTISRGGAPSVRAPDCFR